MRGSNVQNCSGGLSIQLEVSAHHQKIVFGICCAVIPDPLCGPIALLDRREPHCSNNEQYGGDAKPGSAHGQTPESVVGATERRSLSNQAFGGQSAVNGDQLLE